MVSSSTRQVAAQVLVDFYKGRLTNRQFEDAWPVQKEDPALLNIAKGAWILYDDLHEHHFEESYRRSYRVSKLVYLMLTFLNSSLEYEWSGYPFWRLEPVMQLLNGERRKTNRKGNAAFWPFYRKEDYVRSRKSGQLHA